MIKLSNGVELSEDTVVSALKKAGISVEPPKPKHIFEAGDVAYAWSGNLPDDWRLVVKIDGKLHAVSRSGCSTGANNQKEFENAKYKYISRLSI